jgi:hypothetical protein
MSARISASADSAILARAGRYQSIASQLDPAKPITAPRTTSAWSSCATTDGWYSRNATTRTVGGACGCFRGFATACAHSVGLRP